MKVTANFHLLKNEWSSVSTPYSRLHGVVIYAARKITHSFFHLNLFYKAFSTAHYIISNGKMAVNDELGRV